MTVDQLFAFSHSTKKAENTVQSSFLFAESRHGDRRAILQNAAAVEPVQPVLVQARGPGPLMEHSDRAFSAPEHDSESSLCVAHGICMIVYLHILTYMHVEHVTVTLPRYPYSYM